MNDVVKFVSENLPDYKRRWESFLDNFRKENGEHWTGGTSALELKYANIKFTEALRTYTKKIKQNG